MSDHHAAVAKELADKAIGFDADRNYHQARLGWQKASDYADLHLVGADIYYWIKSGYGAALFEDGDHERSIEVSKLALDWCLKINQPLPSLTIAKAHLKLGDPRSAVAHVREAYRLIGDDVFDQLDPADREAMRRDSRIG
jgi:tetratricopeptide (TPR) repeat protein